MLRAHAASLQLLPMLQRRVGKQKKERRRQNLNSVCAANARQQNRAPEAGKLRSRDGSVCRQRAQEAGLAPRSEEQSARQRDAAAGAEVA
jgi:hypothetical protein